MIAQPDTLLLLLALIAQLGHRAERDCIEVAFHLFSTQ